ncbi:hypothetical protein ACQV2W_04440 [Facklamia sp. P12934]
MKNSSLEFKHRQFAEGFNQKKVTDRFKNKKNQATVVAWSR